MAISSVLYLREEVSPSGLSELNQLVEQYPYFSNLHVLKARALHDDQNPDFIEALQKAATRTISRKRLKEWIEGPLQLDFSWEKLPEESSKESLSEEAVEAESSDFEIEISDQSSEAEISEPQNIPQESAIHETISQAVFEIEEPVLKAPKNDFGFKFVKVSKGKAVKKETPVAGFSVESLQAKKPKKEKRGDQKDAIDSFLEKNPSISSPKIDFGDSGPHPDLSARSTRLDEEIVTENMALIYLKQRNFVRALDIYRKLELKFPEKRAYFAALIKNLENTIA